MPAVVDRGRQHLQARHVEQALLRLHDHALRRDLARAARMRGGPCALHVGYPECPCLRVLTLLRCLGCAHGACCIAWQDMTSSLCGTQFGANRKRLLCTKRALVTQPHGSMLAGSLSAGSHHTAPVACPICCLQSRKARQSGAKPTGGPGGVPP